MAWMNAGSESRLFKNQGDFADRRIELSLNINDTSYVNREDGINFLDITDQNYTSLLLENIQIEVEFLNEGQDCGVLLWSEESVWSDWIPRSKKSYEVDLSNVGGRLLLIPHVIDEDKKIISADQQNITIFIDPTISPIGGKGFNVEWMEFEEKYKKANHYLHLDTYNPTIYMNNRGSDRRKKVIDYDGGKKQLKNHRDAITVPIAADTLETLIITAMLESKKYQEDNAEMELPEFYQRIINEGNKITGESLDKIDFNTDEGIDIDTMNRIQRAVQDNYNLLEVFDAVVADMESIVEDSE